MTNETEINELTGMNRADLIKLLSECIKICANRATANRCRPLEGDETRLKYARCVAQLAGPLLSALKIDEELDEIRARVEALEGKPYYDNQEY